MSLHHLGSSRRVQSAEATLAKVQEDAKRAGVTRLADLTGLDTLGVPVWTAIRPNGKSLSSGQGKGLTRPAAQVSALMEAIEVWCAEEVQPDICAALDRVAPDALHPAQLDTTWGYALWHEAVPIPWIIAKDLMAGGECLIPWELVSMDTTQITWRRVNRCSTNGLASGNTREEAILHGLYELVERDAECRWRSKPVTDRLQDAVAPQEVAGICVTIAQLLERVWTSDCLMAFFNLGSPTGVPVYRCVIADRFSHVRPLVAVGQGAHGSIEIALLRAVTEAIQSRATLIAGSRDDKPPTFYSQSSDVRQEESLPPPGQRNLTVGIQEIAVATLEQELSHLLERLETVGVSSVAVADLDQPGMVASVCRVVIEEFRLPVEFKGWK